MIKGYITDVPEGYTGLLSYGSQIILYLDGSSIQRPNENGMVWWWWDKAVPGTNDNFRHNTVLPKVWALFKDHPVLGPILMAYMLGAQE